MNTRFLGLCLALAIRAACAAYADEPAGGADTPVFVTRTGKAYHRETCERLARSRIPLRLGEAAARYAPCALCLPPAPAERDERSAREAGPPPYRVDRERLASFRDADIARMHKARVVRVVDGDTVELRFTPPLPAGIRPLEKTRLIGVDTPETVHPAKAVERFGKEAGDFTGTLLDTDVYVALDWDTRDKYGRLLAYLYAGDGRCHNARLIERGYGHAYTRFPFRFADEFRALEREAREAGRGLWGAP